MRQIEEYISPLIEGQFPAFYRDEGQLFIAFVKAYYEWAESNLQLLTFEDDTNFNKGDTITQGDQTGIIIAVYDPFYLIQLNQFEQFKCNTLCNDLTICTSSSGGSTYIESVRNFNHEYMGRKLVDIKDIDKTIDRFIISFKNKYLPDIQFNTASNKRLFIKNSLDFYRAKGTERAIDLFFKLIYALEAQVYYPGDDIFKLSDNEFVDVQYLEVLASPNNVQFVGQSIVGADSRATAFVERLVRVRKGSRFVEVMYLSNVFGTFRTKEQISTTTLDPNYISKIVGSLSSAEVVRSQPGNRIGDTLSSIDGSGKKAKFRVTGIEDLDDTVEFQLVNSGWGYSSDAEVIGSDIVFNFNNLIIENTEYFFDNEPFRTFETIKQDLVSYTANTAANNFTIIPVSQTVTSYSNSGIEFEGVVVSSNTAAGTIVVNFNSDTYSNDSIITSVSELKSSGNTLTFEVDSGTIVSATANVIAVSQLSTFDYTYTGDTQLQTSDIIYQKDDNDSVYANGIVTFSLANFETGSYTINVERNIGSFRTNRPFYRLSDNAEYTLNKISDTRVGAIDVVNTFYNTANTYGVSTGSYSKGNNSSYTTKANFTIQTFKNNVEYHNFYANDVIDTANLSLTINTSSYGLSGDANAGFTDIISNALNYSNVSIGSLDIILTTDNGSGYDSEPFYIIYDKKTKHLERYDYVIVYSDEQRNFREGEIVVGSTSNARAVIDVHDRANRTILATRLSLSTSSFPTVDEIEDSLTPDISDFIVNETITGIDSNITAVVSYVNERRREERVGLNAEVDTQLFIGEGYVSTVTVIDSGFGYQQDEVVNTRSDRSPNSITGLKLNINTQGRAQGYFTSRKGFLSSDKFLHDNDFYQEYSYQVLTSLPFQTYKKTLVEVLHVAGTKPFGKYIGTTVAPLDINITTEVSDFAIGKIDVFFNVSTIFPPDRVVWTYRPALFDSSSDSTFFGSTLTAGILRPSLIESGENIFGADRLISVLRPALLNNEQTFETADVSHVLHPPIVNNEQTFENVIVSSTLRPSIINNTQTFFGAVVRQSLKPTLETNTQTFESATITQNIIRAQKFNNVNQFFTHSLIGGLIYVEGGYVDQNYVSEDAT
jgi:hypothetical protein